MDRKESAGLCMSCYKPMLGLPTGINENGKKSYRIQTLDKLNCDFKHDPKKEFERIKKEYPESVLIPCGKCEGCRLDYSREWANRMMLELECNDRKAIFLTLTYNDDCVPLAGFRDDGKAYYSLYKKDVQLFIKKLRRYFDGRKGHEYRKIRFFLAGEYGPSTFRPHYHAIVFGISLFDLAPITLKGTNELGQDFFISTVLDQLWFDETKGKTRGFSLVSEVSWRTCAYVARYVQKKQYGSENRFYYENQVPEFSMMSLKPGIGADYLKKKPNMLDFNNIHLSGPEGSLEMPIPKYFLRKEDLFSPEDFATMKENRKVIAENNMILKLQQTGLGYIDYQELEEQNKKESVKRLYRSDL